MKGEEKQPRRTRGERDLLLKSEDATERRLEHLQEKRHIPTTSSVGKRSHKGRSVRPSEERQAHGR